MRRIVSVFTIATIGIGLSTSRGDGKPSTRPTPSDASGRLAELRLRTEAAQALAKAAQAEADHAREEFRRLMGATSATQPSNDELRAKVAGNLARLRVKIDESERQRKALLEAVPSLRSSDLATTPTDMPPGSSPRQFNGFTYYITPLGQ